MVQARRKKTDRRKLNLPSRSSVLILLVGLLSGAVLTALYLGARSGDDSRLGSGLKRLYTRATEPAVPDGSKRVATSAPAPPAPKFDFYTVLPEIERVVSDRDIVQESQQPARDRSGHYMLQVASYGSPEDADRLKARLALSGHEANIQKVSIEGRGVFYRVRLGPYADYRRMQAAKQQVARLGFSAIGLKVSQP